MFWLKQRELPKNFTEEEQQEEYYHFTCEEENVVGRMYTVGPRKSERFYILTLLLHVSCETSFADVKTVVGEVYSTYPEACLRLGLMSGDAELKRAL